MKAASVLTPYSPSAKRKKSSILLRLLDPPLNEFLPEGNIEDIVHEMSSETGSTEEKVFARVEKLSESQPHAWFPISVPMFPLYGTEPVV